MKSIETLLEKKGSAVWSIGPDASVLEAIKFMAEKRIGALPVMEGETLVGIVREGNCAALIATHNHDLAARMDRTVRLEQGQILPA